MERSGSPEDRVGGERPLDFREGHGRWLGEADAPALQQLIEACAEDLRLVAGQAPSPGDAAAILRARPPVEGAREQIALGVYDASGALGAALVAHKGFPRPGCWHLAVVLVRPDLRGRGIATGLLARLERMVEAEGGDAIHTLVPRRSPAAVQLFRRAGFDAGNEVNVPVGDAALRAHVAVRTLPDT
jgi:GNAT superfamily N-acetyltransferase